MVLGDVLRGAGDPDADSYRTRALAPLADTSCPEGDALRAAIHTPPDATAKAGGGPGQACR